MKNISVIGAGTMGNGIAHQFALYNYNVTLIDINEESLRNALSTISNNLDRQIKKGTLEPALKNMVLKNINASISINDISKSDVVIEAVTENKEIKKDIIGNIAKIVSDKCIIASNTSSISITELGSQMNLPERFIGMHFMNPVPVMKLVEIIKGYTTSNEVTRKIIDLTEKIERTPVVVNDYPGFIANRILMPMINEAIYSLYEGIAGVEEIDKIMTLGMAHPMGPLRLADFIGLDVCLSILNVLHEGFGNPKYAPCPLLINMVNAGKLGTKSGEGFYDWTQGKGEIVMSKHFLK